jgi:hypothetical protein
VNPDVAWPPCFEWPLFDIGVGRVVTSIYLLHPDRFENNGRLRAEAKKEFQEMQSAFQHTNSHFAATV